MIQSIAIQAIAGLTPPDQAEATVMTVWPSIAATGLGRALGRAYGIRAGLGPVLTVGNLIVLASIPVALGLFFAMLVPGFNRRYRLTNRRVIVEAGAAPREERSVALDGFDAIDVVVQPGQEWYPAGDLVFKLGPVETLRIAGVPRPETFKQVCLKSRMAFVSVKKALERQPAAV